MHRRLALLIALAVLGTPFRARADPVLTYSFFAQSVQGSPIPPLQPLLIATITIPSPPASETAGWEVTTESTRWRVLTNFSFGGGTAWVDFTTQFRMSSLTGLGIDSGSGTIPLGPPGSQLPNYSILMSPLPGQDEIFIFTGPFGVMYRGDWLAPTLAAAVPEPSPLLCGAVMAAGWALTGMFNRARGVRSRS